MASTSTLTPSPDWLHQFTMADHAGRGRLILSAPADLTDADYWQHVAHAWQDSERQSLTPADWRGLLDAPRPHRELLMTEEERSELAALPERITVYRGVNNYNAITGLSWTLSRDVAEFFAKRWADGDWPGGITTARVLRRRVIAVFNDRGEQELLIHPRHIYAQQRELLR